MNIEEELQHLRKKYIKNTPSDWLVLHGWEDLEGRLARQSFVWPSFVKPVAFAALILAISFTGLVGVAQAANPGQALYPIKILSEKVYFAVAGNDQAKLDRRAKEVIDTAKRDPQNFDSAKQEYQKTVQEVKKDAEKSGKEEEFKRELKKQEDDFNQVLKQNSSSGQKIEEVINVTHDAIGDVKGEKNTNQEREHQEKNRSSGEGSGESSKDH